jgi:hypothetical protein
MTFLFAVWTELHPIGVATGDQSLLCRATIKECADAIERYRADHGRLPADLSLLVPNYLERIPQCSGSFNGYRPVTRLMIVSTVQSLIHPVPSPEAPEYSVVRSPDGSQTYELRCLRHHHARTGYRGDRGTFLVEEE